MAALTFDWFRNIDGENGLLSRNIAWWYHYLKSSKVIDSELDTLANYARRAGDVYKKSGLTFDQYAWAYLYDRLDLVPEAADFFLSSCSGDLIIGYELSRAQKRLIEREGKTYIDVRAHPIRFLTDYFLAAATNSPEIHARLSTLSPNREYIDLHLNIHRARAARRYQKRLDPAKGVVFFAQTQFDSARVREGELIDDEFIIASLDEYLKKEKPSNFYFKHHPHEKMQPALFRALQSMKAKETNTATYDLLSVADIRVCALSSSVCHETDYFGGRPTAFIEPQEIFPKVDQRSQTKDYVCLPANIYDAEVWSFIVAGGNEPNKYFPMPATPFRVASGLSWG